MSDLEEPAAPASTPSTLVDPEPPVPAEPAASSEDAETAPKKESKKGPKKEQSVGRRITFWVGVGLIAAGLSLLGYVAWQLWVTNWISAAEQRRITHALEEDWNSGQGCDKFCPAGKADALIRIPKFGKDYVIPVLEGDLPHGEISQDILAKGFGHFGETAPAGSVSADGKPGNYALAGHRVTHGEPLRQMPDLRPGDLVIVETRLHTYTYRLDTNPNDLIIDFSGTWVLDPFPKNPDGGVGPVLKPDAVDPSCHASRTVHCDIKDMYKKLITLTTCSEIFHTDNRMIAFGHLIEIRDKQVVKRAAGQATAP